MVVSLIALFISLTGGAYALQGTNTVDSGDIINHEVKTPDLHAGAVTRGKIAAGAVTTGKLADTSVTTGKLADTSVTTGKLADTSVTTGKLAGNSVNGSTIVNRSVSGADIGLAAIKGENLATDDVGQTLGLRKGAAEMEVGNSAPFYSGSFFSLTATCIDAGSGQRTAQIAINRPESRPFDDSAGDRHHPLDDQRHARY
jgi:hypothetical protein